MKRPLRPVAAIAYLAWSIPHLIFHLTADGALSTGDRSASEPDRPGTGGRRAARTSGRHST